MTHDDDVRLVIGGREFTGWTGVSIELSVDSCADGFSVSAPFDPSDAALVAAVRPYGYQRAQVYIGPDLVITGTIERVDPKTDETGRTLTVQGRSLTGPLIDCSIDGPLEFYGLSLSTIARQVCKPFGISVVANNDTNPISIARAEYGQTVFDFLNSLAAPRNLLLSPSAAGALQIDWGKSLIGRPVVDRIVEGEGIFLSASASFDGTRRFSLHKVATQFAGEPYITGSATDSAVKVYRPRLASEGDIDQNANFTAARLRTASICASFSASVGVSGWRRSDGKRWSPRDAVSLVAPGALLATESEYVAAGVSLKMDESGRSASLRLVLPETYSTAEPKEEPWA
jgi:prophage tail gpP-like protein